MVDAATARPGGIDLVLFDIGGVLADFAGLAALTELTRARNEGGGRRDRRSRAPDSTSVEDVAARWLLSPWVRRFESGACSNTEFAVGVIAEWQLPFTPEEFLALFLDWLHDPYPGAEKLVVETSAEVTVGCLSNTNALHWQQKISKWPLARRFEHRFLSYELGAVKPDATIFELAVARTGVAAERILFLDDNALNVAGARAVGLRAEQTRGAAEARALLSDYGLLG
jgi:putative hydrolase of the HAD superfamily